MRTLRKKKIYNKLTVELNEGKNVCMPRQVKMADEQDFVQFGRMGQVDLVGK